MYNEINEQSVHIKEDKISHQSHQVPVHIEVDLTENEDVDQE